MGEGYSGTPKKGGKSSEELNALARARHADIQARKKSMRAENVGNNKTTKGERNRRPGKK